MKPFFLGRRWINNQRKSSSVWYNTPQWKIIRRAYLLRTEITKSHLNNRICQHCGVKTSTATPSFYYVLNISLSCNINIPSFIENLWLDLLLRNHLKFSTSDNTILAVWLVHSISITNHYTYVWPYMEINAANVKLFVGSQVSSTKKKMDEKINKFGELSTKEIQVITDNAVTLTTKRPYSSEWEYSTVRIH